MKSFPFDSMVVGYDSDNAPVYDRASNAEELARWFHSFFTDGVFGTGGFVVTAGEGMSVTVSAGSCLIGGRFGYEDTARALALAAADASSPRVDTVVLRLDLSTAVRAIDLYVRTGAPSAAPVAPALTRNDTIWELALCDVYVPQNATAIAQERITDARLSERCGVVTQAMTTLDTETYYQQIRAALSRFEAEEMADFEAWFAMVRDTLSEDAAGQLMLMVQERGVAVHAHTRTGTVNALTTADGVCTPNGRVRLTAEVKGTDTWTVNGRPVSAYAGDEVADGLPVGRWLTFVYDEAQQTLDFKVGGGVKLRVVAAPDGVSELYGKEGLIALVTDVAVRRVWLRRLAPESGMEAGDVWVQYHDASTLAVPLDSAGRLQVGVTRMWQWDGTAWVAKASYVFTDGAWQSTETLLYVDGLMWDGGKWTRGTTKTGTFTLYDDRVLISAKGGGSAHQQETAYSSGMVDVTDYGRLFLRAVVNSARDVSDFYDVKFGLCKANQSPVIVKRIFGDGKQELEYELDISHITGEACLYLWVAANKDTSDIRSLEAYRVWLEY